MLRLAPLLERNCEASPEGRAWRAQLPGRVAELVRRWSLTLGVEPGGAGATCSFVALVHRADGTPAVLKLGLPHMEAAQELAGLRFWNGDPTVHVLEGDNDGAFLLERCEPGLPLSALPAPEADRVLAALLPRLWRVPAPPHPFLPLADMLDYWIGESNARSDDWPDPGFARAGLELLRELGRPAPSDVLLATDLHAGNVLAARREPWLVIDPKPFVGDSAYDATQHLLNCLPRLAQDPCGIVSAFSEQLGVSSERVNQWLIARLAQAARSSRRAYGMSGAEALLLARRLERMPR